MNVEPEGIVSLADEHYFPGLLLLYRSVRECGRVPVACFDAGMTAVQQDFAARKCPGLRILPLPELSTLWTIRNVFDSAPLLAKRNKRVWPLWICPLLIAAAPFRRVFWLDCDIAVLRNLEGLFRLLDDGPVFTPENNAPQATPNRPELYDLLPISRSFDPLEPRVNAGVSGWDLVRDKEVLESYLFPVVRACSDSRVREAISWHDQGALIWAIQKTGLEHRVLKTNEWNLCASRTVLGDCPVPWDEGFLKNLRESIASANIVHWNGTRVPWEREP